MWHFRQIFQNTTGGRGVTFFWQTFQKFPSLFLREGGRLQNMSAKDDENFDKSELI